MLPFRASTPVIRSLRTSKAFVSSLSKTSLAASPLFFQAVSSTTGTGPLFVPASPFTTSFSTPAAANVSEEEINLELYEAAASGSKVNIVKCLRRGASLSWGNPDEAGRTALHAAVDNEHLPAVRALLQAGADVAAADNVRTFDL